MVRRPNRIHLVFSCLVGTCFLAACSDKSEQYDEQYQMLEDIDADAPERCELASEASEWAFANQERMAFKKWSKIKDRFCDLSIAEAYGDSEANDQLGAIIGTYNYPSDYIPDDIQACASNVTTQELHCDAVRSGDQFTFTLAPGKYRVFAKTADWPGYKAYFSNAVRCGLSVDCKDHSAIVLNLEAGETIDGVKPHDWYAGN